MEYNFRKILVAVDASENAMRAVEYTGTIVRDGQDFSVTLLYIIRNPSKDHFSDMDQWKQACLNVKQQGIEALERAEKILAEQGMPEDAIDTKMTEASGSSIATEILKVQQSEGFGTVVVGRRGVSKEEEFLFGSVSNKVVHYARNCTVWVVE